MRCKRAQDVMMQYIDEPLRLGRFKTSRFFGHIAKCDVCREDFALYEEMLTGFAPDLTGAYEPAAGFEAAVTARARAARAAMTGPGQVVMIAWCALSVVLGLCVLTLINGDAARAAQIFEMAERQYNMLAGSLAAAFEAYRYILAAIMAAAVVVASRLFARRRGTTK